MAKEGLSALALHAGQETGVTSDSIRLSIGLEDVENQKGNSSL